MTEVSHPHKLRKSFIITNLRILEFMVNERIIKNIRRKRREFSMHQNGKAGNGLPFRLKFL